MKLLWAAIGLASVIALVGQHVEAFDRLRGAVAGRQHEEVEALLEIPSDQAFDAVEVMSLLDEEEGDVSFLGEAAKAAEAAERARQEEKVAALRARAAKEKVMAMREEGGLEDGEGIATIKLDSEAPVKADNSESSEESEDEEDEPRKEAAAAAAEEAARQEEKAAARAAAWAAEAAADAWTIDIAEGDVAAESKDDSQDATTATEQMQISLDAGAIASDATASEYTLPPLSALSAAHVAAPAVAYREERKATDEEVQRVSKAALDQAGYVWIAKFESTPAMMLFAERLVKKLGLEVRDRGRFEGMVQHFSGERAYQSFYSLKQEILGAAAVEDSWVVEKGVNQTSLLNVGAKATGINAPLNERGYATLVKQKSNQAMTRFMRRTVNDLGYEVVDEGGLRGLVPYYSGELGSQSFAKLRVEIVGSVRQPQPWVTSGSDAILSEVGYQLVARMKNDGEMKKFVRRVGHHFGCTVADKEPIIKNVADYNGRKGVKSLAWLEEQVKKTCKLTHTEEFYGNMHDVVGKGGVLQIRLKDSDRYKQSAQELRSAGVVPTEFQATDAKATSSEELESACPLKSDASASKTCSRHLENLGIGSFDKPHSSNEGEDLGCASPVEQAIADSHRRALKAAQDRTDSDWTAILEDDVVPIQPGSFNWAFKKAWAKVPAWAKMVRLSWCTFEGNLGSIRKPTYADAGPLRLVANMTWADVEDQPHYYTGGCTTGYMVHKSLIPELLGIFPCCCPIDCCLERQLFYAPSQPWPLKDKFRGQQILMNLDAWESMEESYNYTGFNQNGVFVQDNREILSERPGWNEA